MPDYAFPLKSSFAPDENGLTKRELFAAMAMHGILSRNNVYPAEVAESAVAYADMLLKELEGK